MKKLMIAAAIVCAAAFANAAVVNWQVGYIDGAGEGGKGWAEGTPIAEGCTAQLLVYAIGEAGAVGEQVAFTSGDSSTEVYDGYMFGTTSDSLANDTQYYAKVIVTDANGSTLESNMYTIETSSLSESADPVFAYTAEAMNVLGTLDPTYGTFNAAGWQSVPEPTSGLLLLLGVAGLALRRRRA